MAMKFYLVSVLLYLGVRAEERTHLDHFGTGSLQLKDTLKSGNAKLEESKYTIKSERSQQQYHIPNQYYQHINALETYLTPSRSHSASLVTHDERSQNIHRKQLPYPHRNDILDETVPLLYYKKYRQTPLPLKQKIPTQIYESQKIVRQPEAASDNLFQSVKQNVVTAADGENENKGNGYLNIPMMHILRYYPNLDVNFDKIRNLRFSQLSSATSDHLSIPLYTSLLYREPEITVRPTSPKYNSADLSVSSASKELKSAVHAPSRLLTKYANPSLLDVPTYVIEGQPTTQAWQLYMDMYISPHQPQHISPLVLVQPPRYAVTSDELGHASQSVNKFSDTIMNQHVDQNASQIHANTKEPEEPQQDLVPPQILAQNFKVVTPLHHDQLTIEVPVSKQNGVGISEPRSLLDSYIPSKLIAAQDAARYQERTIQLKSDVLPMRDILSHTNTQKNQ